MKNQIKKRGLLDRKILERPRHKADIEDLKKLKSQYKKQRAATWGTRGVAALGVGGLVSGVSFKTKRNQQKEQALGQAAYQQGKNEAMSAIMQDPKFPIEAKVRMLENKGVLKIAGFLGMHNKTLAYSIGLPTAAALATTALSPNLPNNKDAFITAGLVGPSLGLSYTALAAALKNIKPTQV